MNIYDFKAKAQDGSEVSLSDYKGKVLLVVNTATGCGFTPQYDELQDLYDEFKDKGLEILDFPCNQFGSQAPGDDEEIHSFCTGRYGITFPQFSKVDVNGENALPLYAYLKSQKGFEGFGKGPKALAMSAMLKKIGTLARKDIELMLGDKVFLETWVKVKKNWRDKKLDLADFGYNKKEY